MAGFTTATPADQEKYGVIPITMYPIGVDTSFVKGAVTKDPVIGSAVKLAPAAWTVKWSIKGTGFTNLIKAERKDANASVDGNTELSVTGKQGILRIGDQEPNVSLTTGSAAGKAGRELTLDIGTYTSGQDKIGTAESVNFNLEYVPFSLSEWTGPSSALFATANGGTPVWIIRNGVNDAVQDSGTAFDTATPWDGTANGNGAVKFEVSGWDGTGRFLAVAKDKAVWSEDGGATWTKKGGTQGHGEWYGVAYGGGRFVVIPHGSDRTYWSTSGAWNREFMSSSADWLGVAYGDGRFVTIGSNKAAWSTDGASWAEAATLPIDSTSALTFNRWYGVAYGGNRFVAVMWDADIAAYSEDGGATWTEVSLSSSTSGTWVNVAYGGGRFVAISSTSVLNSTCKAALSTDGVTWTEVSLPSAAWQDVAYGE
jgi:hypothetical protein